MNWFDYLMFGWVVTNFLYFALMSSYAEFTFRPDPFRIKEYLDEKACTSNMAKLVNPERIIRQALFAEYYHRVMFGTRTKQWIFWVLGIGTMVISLSVFVSLLLKEFA